MKFDDERDSEKLSETFAKHARDFDDLQNEVAGRDVGRIDRFLNGAAPGTGGEARRKKEREEALTRLQLLLADPAYAAQYRKTSEHLNNAQDRLDKLLERVRREIELSELALEGKRSRAARLEDGTRVYRDKHGDVRTENGDKVSDDLAAGVIWNGSEPSYESMQDDHQRTSRLQEIEGDAHAGQSRIGEMQEELKSDDDPKTVDEMKSLRKEANDIVGDLEERLNADLSSNQSATKAAQPGTEVPINVSVPEL